MSLDCPPCPIHIAPSSHGKGWGVFASRDIARGEIIEIAPLFLRFSEQEVDVLQRTALNDYHYEYWAWNGVTASHERQFQISFGYMLYFNHSSARANISYQHFGREPDLDHPEQSVGLGYYALRDIRKDEELLTDYGGAQWFRARGMDLVEDDDTEEVDSKRNELERPTSNELEGIVQAARSSKLYCVFDIKTRQRILKCHKEVREFPPYELEPFCESVSSYTSSLPTLSTGFGSVICQHEARAGDILELAPALILPKTLTRNTLLESMVVEWKDLLQAEKRKDRTIQVMVVSEADEKGASPTKTKSELVDTKMDDTVLLPLAGSLSLIARDLMDFNAEFQVEDDPYSTGSFLLRAVSTRTISVGEVVVAKLPRHLRLSSLVEELALTGQNLVPGVLNNDDGDD